MESTTTQSQQISEVKNNTGTPSIPNSNYQNDFYEINLLEYIYVLIKNKWWVIGVFFLGLILGFATAFIKGPTYVAEAVIAAKESNNTTSTALSSLGMLGGVVASQLNISQNPGLDKIELILDSKKFNAELIEKYNLLPEIFKNTWPKDYKKWFDTISYTWNDSFPEPNLLSIGKTVKSKFLTKEITKNGVMTVSIKSHDSTFTDTLIASYLDYLNLFIKTTVQAEAKANVSYLDSQLITITDPLLREKVQNMIASEMEKAMIVSKEAYKLIDPPLRNRQFKEKIIFPLVSSFGFSLLITILLVLSHAFSCIQKNRSR